MPKEVPEADWRHDGIADGLEEVDSIAWLTEPFRRRRQVELMDDDADMGEELAAASHEEESAPV